jgi:hypothetical protein
LQDKNFEKKSAETGKEEKAKNDSLKDDELGKVSGGLSLDIACAICGKPPDKCNCKGAL